ncbi:MAG: hypothetical protein ABEJ70_06015 [Halobacteriaceae archaeon]
MADGHETVYATRGLVETLLRMAADAAPRELSVALATSPAARLQGETALPPATPVFTDFYLPGAGDAIRQVFGMDLSVPAGQTRGRFVSHPDGRLDVSMTDDVAARVLVATPPWTVDAVAAYDRRNRALGLELVDAEPPVEDVP